MKSKIRSLADYRDIRFKSDIVIHCPEEYIEKQMRNTTRAYKHTESVPTLGRGDVALLELKSGLAKFNRDTVPVTVGEGLYDSELERQLVGRSMGETFEASVQGEKVTVTVKQATRTVFPEPTDAMCAEYAATHKEFEGIATAAGFRRKIIEDYHAEQKENAVREIMGQIIDYVWSKSKWDFDEGELNTLLQIDLDNFREELKREGKNFDALTDGEISDYFGIATRERLMEMTAEGIKYNVGLSLWSAACCGQSAEKCSLEAEPDFKFLEDYVRSRLLIKEEK